VTAGAGVFGTGNPFTPINSNQFYITSTANDLYLNYAAVPEPGSLTTTFIAASAAAAYRARRRRKETRTPMPTAIR